MAWRGLPQPHLSLLVTNQSRGTACSDHSPRSSGRQRYYPQPRPDRVAEVAATEHPAMIAIDIGGRRQRRLGLYPQDRRGDHREQRRPSRGRIGSQGGQPVVVKVGPAKLDANVGAANKAALLEALAKCGDELGSVRCGAAAAPRIFGLDDWPNRCSSSPEKCNDFNGETLSRSAACFAIVWNVARRSIGIRTLASDADPIGTFLAPVNLTAPSPPPATVRAHGSSRNRSIPGAAGFLVLSQALLRPDR